MEERNQQNKASASAVSGTSGNAPAPGTFLGEKDRLEAELSGFSVQREQLWRDLQDENKAETREREKTIKDRRGEISDTYDKQLRAVDAEMKSIRDKRQKARNQGVKERIGDRTAALSDEVAELKRKMTNLFKDRHVPAVCRTGFFYIFTMPRGIAEIGSALLGFVIVFGLLPVLVHTLIGSSAVYIWAAIYVLDILLFGGIFVWLNSLKTKHIDTVREGRKLRSQIRDRRKEIARIAKGIRKEKDDAIYDLQAFDDALAQKTQERAEIERKKTEALEQFDSVTRNVLADEVAQKHAPRLRELSEALSAMDMKIKGLEENVKNDGKTGDGKGTLSEQG